MKRLKDIFNSKNTIGFAVTHPIQYQTPLFKYIYKKKKNFLVIFRDYIVSKNKIWDKEFQ